LTAIFLLHVSNTEDESEKEAKGAYSDITNGQEIVLSTQGVRCREDKAFLTLERSNLILVVDPKLIASSIKTVWDSTPEFSEVWKACSSHPDDEMLVSFHVNPLNLFIVVFTIWKLISFNIFEFVFDI
jgi:hypothetical protein